MQRATRDVLYYETGRDNPVTMTVRPGDVFEVETQMNRGRDSSEVPEELRELWNAKRSDDHPTDRGNPTSGAIWVEGAEPGHALIVHVEDIQVHGIGYTQYRGSSGAAPGFMGDSGVGPQFKVVRIENDRIIWNDRLSLPVEPMLGVVGVAPERERWHNGWAGEWGGNFDIQEITAGASVSIPVQVLGALLHVGDMHARQGDGGDMRRRRDRDWRNRQAAGRAGRQAGVDDLAENRGRNAHNDDGPGEARRGRLPHRPV